MPSKEWERIRRIVAHIRKIKEDVPFIDICNKEFISLKTVYMLAQQIAQKYQDITYKKGKFIYNGG